MSVEQPFSAVLQDTPCKSPAFLSGQPIMAKQKIYNDYVKMCEKYTNCQYSNKNNVNQIISSYSNDTLCEMPQPHYIVMYYKTHNFPYQKDMCVPWY